MREPTDDSGGRGRPVGIGSVLALGAGIALSGLGLVELWAGCLDLGGALTMADLRDMMQLRREATAAEHDIVARCLNDWPAERGHGRLVACCEELI